MHIARVHDIICASNAMDQNTGVMSAFSSDLRDASFQLPRMSELVDNDLQLAALKPHTIDASENCRSVELNSRAECCTQVFLAGQLDWHYQPDLNKRCLPVLINTSHK